MFNSLKFTATLGAALLLFSAGAKADFITNGNFTYGTNATTAATAGQIGYNTSVYGWTNGTYSGSTVGYNFLFSSSSSSPSATGNSGTVGLYGPIAPSPAGGNFIGDDGAYQQAAISQTINGLTVGAQYSVGFYWAGAQQTGYSGITTEQWLVSLGSQQLATNVITDQSQSFTGWQYTTLTFTATASSEALSFLAAGTPNGQPPFSLLDGVTMNQVPEPASMSLFGAGLAALGFVRRRKQRRQ